MNNYESAVNSACSLQHTADHAAIKTILNIHLSHTGLNTQTRPADIRARLSDIHDELHNHRGENQMGPGRFSRLLFEIQNLSHALGMMDALNCVNGLKPTNPVHSAEKSEKSSSALAQALESGQLSEVSGGN